MLDGPWTDIEDHVNSAPIEKQMPHQLYMTNTREILGSRAFSSAWQGRGFHTRNIMDLLALHPRYLKEGK